MAYLKPQSPLQDKSSGDFFYPLTTSDQVILDNGSRLSGTNFLSVEKNDSNEGEISLNNADLLGGQPPEFYMSSGGDVSIDMENKIEGDINPINADTLGGYASSDYVLKTDAMLVSKNYSVVGGIDEPSNPTENMIWVNTDVNISNHVFSKNKPKNPVQGMVWFTLGGTSNVAFHTAKIGDVYIDEVYPLYAKQYVSGEWVDKTSKSYQSGEWVGWVPRGALFWSGIGEIVPFDIVKESNVSVTPSEECVEYNRSSTSSSLASYYTQNKFSFDGYSKLKIKVVMTAFGERDELYARLFYSTDTPVSHPSSFTQIGSVKFDTITDEYEINISNQSGSFYVGVCGGMIGKIYGIWLE